MPEYLSLDEMLQLVEKVEDYTPLKRPPGVFMRSFTGSIGNNMEVTLNLYLQAFYLKFLNHYGIDVVDQNICLGHYEGRNKRLKALCERVSGEELRRKEEQRSSGVSRVREMLAKNTP